MRPHNVGSVSAKLAIAVMAAMAAWSLLPAVSGAQVSGLLLALRLFEIVTIAALAYVVSYLLINRLEGSHERMAQMALTDPLTGLPNRRGLMAHFAEVRNRTATLGGAQGFAVLHIDLDHFKAINDALGHDAGDHVLRVASARMLDRLRGNDLLARVGGDEFCAVLDAMPNPDHAGQVAQRIIRALEEPVDYSGQPCRAGASIGIAQGRGLARSAVERVLMDADLAVFEAKSAGRGQFTHFKPQMREDLERDRDIAERICAALDRGEISPVFRPVVDAAAGALLSVEAEPDWRRLATAALPAGHFLRVARTHDLMGKVTDVMLEALCAAYAGWRRDGVAPPQISLDLPATELKRKGTSEKLLWALDKAGIAPGHFAIEVGEQVCYGRGHELALGTLGNLAGAGIAIVLDDLGQDQGAVANIAKLNAKAAKIDPQIVAGIGRPDDGGKLIKGLLSLAHSMEIAVYAKGADTAEQAEFLRCAACDGLQGDAIAAPMPAAEFTAWLADRAERPAKRHSA